MHTLLQQGSVTSGFYNESTSVPGCGLHQCGIQTVCSWGRVPSSCVVRVAVRRLAGLMHMLRAILAIALASSVCAYTHHSGSER